MRFLRDALLTVLLILLVAVVLGYVFTRDGLSARTEPPQIEAAIARRIRTLSIPAAASKQVSPVAGNPQAWEMGGMHFEDHCAVCHDENGSGKSEIGKNLYPKVPDMRQQATQQLSDGELYFVIANGIRYTGMPAWADEHSPAEIWDMVAFIRKLPKLSPEELEQVMPKEGEEGPHEHEHGEHEHDHGH